MSWSQTAACRTAGVGFADVLAALDVCRACPHTGVDGPCYAEWRSMAEQQRSANPYVWAGMTPAQLLATEPGRRNVDHHGRTRPQRRTLATIEACGPISATDIARRLGQSGTTTNRVLLQLVNLGLIEQQRDGRHLTYRVRRIARDVGTLGYDGGQHESAPGSCANRTEGVPIALVERTTR